MIELPLAQSYRAQGLCVLPATVAKKRPAIGSWKTYQANLPADMEVSAWFANTHDACCLICGRVSGNLEIIDFDGGGALYEPWQEIVHREAPDLLDRLVIERTPSGGLHVAYRCTDAVSGNLKLAQCREEFPTGEPVQRFGKTAAPRQDPQGRWHLITTLIETRGEGGLCLCAPSRGYDLLQGDYTKLPVLTADEREVLLRAAWALNTVHPEPADPQPATDEARRPGDVFNERADVPSLLQQHGWTLVQDGENQHWSRPGKGTSTSATLRQGVFYVFSTNAAPFEAQHAYRPFAVYALLEHHGDYRAAAGALREQGFGAPAAATNGVDLSGLLPGEQDALPFDLQTFAETPEGDIRWLWPGVIPRGMVSLIGGKQGLGKSFLICDLAARISSGRPLPDGTINSLGRVLLLAREDDASCVLLPRLRAAKADLSRVSWSVFHRTEGAKLGIDLAAHADLLIRSVAERAFDLIVVDTFAAFAPAGTDANAAQDVRVLLDALTRVARESGAAVLVVAHLRKSGQADGDPMDAIAGSAQMTAGVRVAAMLEKGQLDGERRFHVVKSNLGPTDSLRWTWRFAWPDPFTEGASDVPHIEWISSDDERGEARAHFLPAQSSEGELIRHLIAECIITRPRSQNMVCDLVCSRLRQQKIKPRRSDIVLTITELLDEGCIVEWNGPRGSKFVGKPGSQSETPEVKALQLARTDPTITVHELRTRAGCRKETACEALRLAKISTNTESK